MKAKAEKLKLTMLVFAILLACAVVVAGTVFAWVASNSYSFAGMKPIGVVGRCTASFSLYQDREYKGYGDFDFGGIKCGGKLSFYIKLINNDSIDYENVNIRFAAPDAAAEKPVAVVAGGEETLYYLGTQLRITEVWNIIDDLEIGRAHV